MGMLKIHVSKAVTRVGYRVLLVGPSETPFPDILSGGRGGGGGRGVLLHRLYLFVCL